MFTRLNSFGAYFNNRSSFVALPATEWSQKRLGSRTVKTDFLKQGRARPSEEHTNYGRVHSSNGALSSFQQSPLVQNLMRLRFRAPKQSAVAATIDDRLEKIRREAPDRANAAQLAADRRLPVADRQKAIIDRERYVRDLRETFTELRKSPPEPAAQADSKRPAQQASDKLISLRYCVTAMLESELPGIFAPPGADKHATTALIDKLVRIDDLFAGTANPKYSFDRLLQLLCNFHTIRELAAHGEGTHAVARLADITQVFLDAMEQPASDAREFNMLIGIDADLDASMIELRKRATTTAILYLEEGDPSDPVTAHSARIDASQLVDCEVDLARAGLRLQRAFDLEQVTPMMSTLNSLAIDQNVVKGVRERLGPENAEKVGVVLAALYVIKESAQLSQGASRLANGLEKEISSRKRDSSQWQSRQQDSVQAAGDDMAPHDAKMAPQYQHGDLQDPDNKAAGGFVPNLFVSAKASSQQVLDDMVRRRQERNGSDGHDRSDSQQAMNAHIRRMQSRVDDLRALDFRFGDALSDRKQSPLKFADAKRIRLNGPLDVRESPTDPKESRTEPSRAISAKRDAFLAELGLNPKERSLLGFSPELMRDELMPIKACVLSLAAQGVTNAQRARNALDVINSVIPALQKAPGKFELGHLSGRKNEDRAIQLGEDLFRELTGENLDKLGALKDAKAPGHAKAVDALKQSVSQLKNKDLEGIDASAAADPSSYARRAMPSSAADRQIEAQHLVREISGIRGSLHNNKVLLPAGGLFDVIRLAILVERGETPIAEYVPATRSEAIVSRLQSWGFPTRAKEWEVSLLISSDFSAEQLEYWREGVARPVPPSVRDDENKHADAKEEVGASHLPAHSRPDSQDDGLGAGEQFVTAPHDGKAQQLPDIRIEKPEHVDAALVALDKAYTLVDDMALGSFVKLSRVRQGELNSGLVQLPSFMVAGLKAGLAKIDRIDIGRMFEGYWIQISAAWEGKGAASAGARLVPPIADNFGLKLDLVGSVEGSKATFRGTRLQFPQTPEGKADMGRVLKRLFDNKAGPIGFADFPASMKIRPLTESKVAHKESLVARAGFEYIPKPKDSNKVALGAGVRVRGTNGSESFTRRIDDTNGTYLLQQGQHIQELIGEGAGGVRFESKDAKEGTGKMISGTSGDLLSKGRGHTETVTSKRKLLTGEDGTLKADTTEFDSRILLNAGANINTIIALGGRDFKLFIDKLRASEKPEHTAMLRRIEELTVHDQANVHLSLVRRVHSDALPAINSLLREAQMIRRGIRGHGRDREAQAREYATQANELIESSLVAHRVRINPNFAGSVSKTPKVFNLGVVRYGDSANSAGEHLTTSVVLDPKLAQEAFEEARDSASSPRDFKGRSGGVELRDFADRQYASSPPTALELLARTESKQKAGVEEIIGAPPDSELMPSAIVAVAPTACGGHHSAYELARAGIEVVGWTASGNVRCKTRFPVALGGAAATRDFLFPARALDVVRSIRESKYDQPEDGQRAELQESGDDGNLPLQDRKHEVPAVEMRSPAAVFVDPTAAVQSSGGMDRTHFPRAGGRFDVSDAIDSASDHRLGRDLPRSRLRGEALQSEIDKQGVGAVSPGTYHLRSPAGHNMTSVTSKVQVTEPSKQGFVKVSYTGPVPWLDALGLVFGDEPPERHRYIGLLTFHELLVTAPSRVAADGKEAGSLAPEVGDEPSARGGSPLERRDRMDNVHKVGGDHKHANSNRDRGAETRPSDAAPGSAATREPITSRVAAAAVGLAKVEKGST